MDENSFSRRQFLWFSAGATGVVALAGCGGKSPQGGGKPKKGGTLTIGQADNPTTLDPQDTNDNLSFSIEKTMFERLIDFDQHMKLVPSLATAWHASADAKEFTLDLRHGVTFHDGAPFDAEAVKTNFDRVRDKKNGLKRWSLYSNIAEIVPDGKYRVRFRLSEPFGAFLANLAHPAGGIISPKAIKENGKDLSHHPVGTGPFSFVEWKLGEQVKVKRFPKYWDAGKIRLDAITFKPVPEAQSRLDGLRTKELQLIYPLPPVDYKAMKKASGTTVWEGPSIFVNRLSMNVLHKPFDDKRVRQAMNYAVDKKALVAVVAYGHAKPMDSPIAPNVFGYSHVMTYPHDVAKAKSLLKEAGYPNGFSFTLWTSNTTEARNLAEAIQQQLAQASIKMKIQTFEGPTLDNLLFQPASQNKEQASLDGWSPSTGDADWGLRPLLSKEAWPPTLYNTSFYDNPTVNKKIDAALATADKAERQKLYAEVQKIVMDDAPWVFLYISDQLAGTTSDLHGIYVLPDQTLVVKNGYFTG
ncbi:MAG TPA: ABC transporter substrate-binding protein [Streptosporangiales bacterium]